MIILVGRRGNLSLALQQIYKEKEMQVIGSDVAQRWTIDGGEQHIKNDLEDLRINPSLIINAAGEINSKAPLSRLHAVNYQLPKNLAIYARSHGIKLVTFGTILENLRKLSNSNPYLLSKCHFFDYFKKEIDTNTNSIHLQIHTWYGVTNPNKGMFLGQMLDAIVKKEPFNMSNGTQLREYHNIYDDLNAVEYLLSQNSAGVIQVNHGEVLSLKEIATSIFDSFNALHLLNIGSLNASEHEIMTKKFEPNKLLGTVKFRDSKQGIITDFNRLMEELR